MARDHTRVHADGYVACNVQSAPHSKRIVRVTSRSADVELGAANNNVDADDAHVETMIRDASRLVETRITTSTASEIVR